MDIQLYYREKGRGKPLILLHGNNDSGDHFIAQKNTAEYNSAVLEFLMK